MRLVHSNAPADGVTGAPRGRQRLAVVAFVEVHVAAVERVAVPTGEPVDRVGLDVDQGVALSEVVGRVDEEEVTPEHVGRAGAAVVDTARPVAEVGGAAAGVIQLAQSRTTSIVM